jgi:hypothetical protein
MIKRECISKQGILKHIQLEITVNSFIRSKKASRVKIGLLLGGGAPPPPPTKKQWQLIALRGLCF